MGLRGELFSTRVILQNRSYFFNVKENRMGDLYLNIVESKNKDEGGFNRQSVILFSDDLQEFLKGFDEALRILEKEVRARRRSSGQTVIRNTPSDTEKGGRRGIEEKRGGRTVIRSRKDTDRGVKNEGGKNFTEKPGKSRPPKDNKRVVVRKK